MVRPRIRVALPAMAALACVIAILCLPSGSPAAGPPVYVFPTPGARLAAPQTQITFRGIPASQLGTIAVTGSSSGVHSGQVLSDSDGEGGSFVPAQPFQAGEVVTVNTTLNLVGGTSGRYTFKIANPASPLPIEGRSMAERVHGAVLKFHSRPDLTPAREVITKFSSHTARGDIFLAPQHGPVQTGPMLLDSNGYLLWFKSLPKPESAMNFRVQRYRGQPVLTWWQGDLTAGVGIGEDVINDRAYQQIAVVKAGNGLSADLHEFLITRQNTAFITAYYPVYWDASGVGGSKHQVVLDSVVQEIDIPTGLVLFQWDSLDHIPLHEAYNRPPFDYFHVNSVDQDKDGNVVISSRNTSAAYKIDHHTGHIIWRLGGKHSSFKLASGLAFAFQHDVRVVANNDRYVTMFDDSGGPPRANSQSRGLKLLLDLTHKTARAVAVYNHSPPLVDNYEGNYQQLRNRDAFVGWGQTPYFSEFDRHGSLIFDGHFIAQVSLYRAYRFVWRGAPKTLPALAARNQSGKTIVYASWNGATNVARWQVLGGASPTALAPVGSAARHGFETSITMPTEAYVAVQALDTTGHVLATSNAVAPH